MLPTLIAVVSLIVAPALAQVALGGRTPSHCIAFADSTLDPGAIRAAARDGAHLVEYRSQVPPETVRIGYIDHPMF